MYSKIGVVARLVGEREMAGGGMAVGQHRRHEAKGSFESASTASATVP